jgi:hypothetical protein
MMATIGLPGLLLVLASGPTPTGILPAALFALINGALVYNGMT